MNYTETAVTLECANECLVGVLARPREPRSRGLLIVVGGPQYRGGSHRQFTLLARALAEHGLAVLRFDCRGMGDSSGAPRSFERIDEDLKAAVDRFLSLTPELKEVVIWGLCDAASAALFYAHQDRRVAGLALANPWVRTVEGEARAYVKHYYAARLLQPDLWRKVFSGGFDFFATIRSFGRLATQAFAPRNGPANDTASLSLPERMREGCSRFEGRILVLLSGDDLTAQEFKDVVAGSAQWQALLRAPRVTWHDMPGANHTFSRREWRDEVAAVTLEWTQSW